MKEKNDRNTVRELFQLNELFDYFFRKRKGTTKRDFSLRSMHFVNKLSMIIFLLAVIYLMIKHFFL